MLQLHVQNTPVDLESAASIALSFNCPAFDGDSVERAWSLPFKLPLSAKNRLLFKSMNRLDTRTIADSIAAKVVGDGQDLTGGVYVVENAVTGYLDGHFENIPLAGLKGLSNQKLRNLLGTITIPQTEKAQWIIQVRPPTLVNAYRIEINGQEFNPSTRDDHNAIGLELAASINQYFGENVAAWVSGVFVIILKPLSSGVSYQIRVADQVNNRGLNIVSGSYSFAGAQKANFLNFVRLSLSDPRSDISFLMTGNANLYEGKNEDWTGIINFATLATGSAVWQVGDSGGSLKVENFPYTYIPYIRVSHIFQKIAAFLGVPSVVGLFDEWTELNTLVVYNNHPLDEVKEDFEFYDLKFVNAHTKVIELKNHVPDITAREFLTQFCQTFNLWWQIQNGQLVFRKKVNILRGSYAANWTAFIVSNSIERGYKTANGVKLRLKEDDTDKATSSALLPYVEGNGAEDIELPTGALPERAVQQGRSTCFSEQTKSETVSVLRFMFDRGAVDDDWGSQFMQAASSVMGGKLSIQPADLWAWTWKESGEYLAYGWPLTASFELPLSETNGVLKWRNCLRRIDTPFGSVVAAIESVDITEKVNGTAATKVIFKVKN